ncbi:MAG: helix-turn-helix transcriptional regulator [Muribaculaceae bacterium]|nr:helix-turn-helix transcriptional regulator [Muribaculaceae bacterium]
MNYEESVYKVVGSNVRKYRLIKGFSQEKLSELLDANSKFIGHVERCERYVSLKKLIQLSQILEISMEDFFMNS